MISFIIKRVLVSILIIFIVSVFAFSLMHILPGDPARLALGEDASQEDVDALRKELNLDKPILTQYTIWITGIMKGDFGYSISYQRPVSDVLLERLPRTISIGIPAIILSSIIGISFGVISALKRGKFIDRCLTVFATIGVGAPQFWIGILGIYFFSLKLRMLPIQGWVSPSEDFNKFVYYAILPVICLSLHMIASVSRQTRSNMLDVINEDYIRTARANGIAERRVIFRHALKNALIPIVTIIGLQIRIIIGGSLMVEQVFSIAGIGQLMRLSVQSRDYLIVQSGVLIISAFTVLINLLVDILYGLINPRIRESWG